jgi:dephospho-CoA kinase
MITNHKILALTGQSGAGKTTVARIFAGLGMRVVDCDSVARDAARDHSPCVEEIGRRFPQLVSCGKLLRAETAALIFSDNEAKNTYQQIIFPYLTYLLMRMIAETDANTTILLDAPTLFESGLDRICGKIIAVTAAERGRRERIILRDSITAEQANARLFAQQSEDFFASHCDFLIVNDGDLTELERKVRQIYERLIQPEMGWRNQQA